MATEVTVAVVGATGLVGREILKLLAERAFPVRQLLPVASANSRGTEVPFGEAMLPVVGLDEALAQRPQLVLFSAGGGVSKEYAPQFAAAGALVIDNSSAWRMQADVPLVVPEVNEAALANIPQRIIANPNCVVAQHVLALHPLHRAWGLERLIITTFQSVTGTGKAAVDQLMNERRGQTFVGGGRSPYPHPIDLNVLPQCDAFLPSGYTKEEQKQTDETRKILGIANLRVTATCVRVPVVGGHSEAINAEFQRPVDADLARDILRQAPGLRLLDNPATSEYPMPRLAHGQDEVLVGRIRADESHPHALNLFVVGDNLRKGAALNAVQLAEALLRRGAFA